MKKSKKILAVVVTVVLALLLTAMVVLLCLHPSKKDGSTATGGNDDTIQTPGDNTDSNGGSSDNNDETSGSGSSDSTGSPSDSQTPAEDYAYDTPSAITLSADKTELAPGDTFTLTIELSTNRTDMYWMAVSLVIGPMSDETTVSTDIASNFELVGAKSYTLPDWVKKTGWYDTSSDKFDNSTAGMLISLSSRGGTYTQTTEKFVVTVDIKVKETATPVESFMFGITDANRNRISYRTADATMLVDQADGTSKVIGSTDAVENGGITTQKLTMSIKAKSN